MSATDQDIHDAIMRQIMDAVHSEFMRGIQNPAVDTYATRDAIRSFIAAYPWAAHDQGLPFIGDQFASVAGTRMFLVEKPGVWFLTVIRKHS